MDQLVLAQYFFNEGKRRFSNDGHFYDPETRASYFRVAYNLCVESNNFPEFLPELCLTLAGDQFRNGGSIGALRYAVEVLTTAYDNCPDSDKAEEILKARKSYQEGLDEMLADDEGITEATRGRFHGVEKLEEFWGKDFSFHDCWVIKFHYDRIARTVTLDLADPDADYDNPKEYATLRFNGVVRFTFDTECGSDYVWQLNSRIAKYNNWLVVEFESQGLQITCNDVDVLGITK